MFNSQDNNENNTQPDNQSQPQTVSTTVNLTANQPKIKKKIPLRKRPYAKVRQILGFKYFVLGFFWLIFFLLLLAVFTLFTIERLNINSINNVNQILEAIARSDNSSQKTDLYQQLLDIKYPLIDFSLLTFLFFKGSLNSRPINDWPTTWNQRVTSINVAYSYVFISALIAFVAFIMYIVIIIKLYMRAGFEKRYHLQPKFHNGYELYDSRIYLRFTRSLAIVFCFFNFLSTLIAIAYGVILLLASYIFWYAFKEKSVILLRRRWWKTPNFILYTSIILVQNGYNILKSLFSSQFGVDLDLILSILFPIGTITVILAILVRNLLSTNITEVKKAIKKINLRVTSFRIFFYSQREKALEDYSFVAVLPLLIKKPLENNLITTRDAYNLMIKVNDAAIFFEKHFNNESERNYMLYHLFNEITDPAEIEDIMINVLKVEEKKKGKKLVRNF